MFIFRQKNRLYPDITIWDKQKNKIIGIVLSKENLNENKFESLKDDFNLLLLQDNYRSATCYIINAVNNEIQVYEYKNNSISEITRSDFPSPKELEKIYTLKEKILYQRIKQKRLKNENKLRVITASISLSITFISLLATAYGFYKSDTEKKRSYSLFADETIKRINLLNSTVGEIENKIRQTSNITNSIKTGADSTTKSIIIHINDLDKKYASLRNDTESIKATLEINPIEVYQIKEIKTQVESLEKEIENERTLVNNKIENIEKNYNLFVGLLFGTIIALISLSIPVLIYRKRD